MKQILQTQLLGTFQLNGSLDIHSWYNYLAGYSAEFVKKILEEENITPDNIVLDPFCGVATTNIVCKKANIQSVGIEINPFTSFVAKTKLFWDFTEKELSSNYSNFFKQINKIKKTKKFKSNNDLLNRAFSPKILNELLKIKETINNFKLVGKKKKLRNLYLLCLISILREVSNYESFSPYLKRRETMLKNAPVIEIYQNKLKKMMVDLYKVKDNKINPEIYNTSAKSLDFLNQIFDVVITSPPYLNNWDYSWITKIELFFLDYAQTNEDLNNGFRKNLIKSSTYLLNNSEPELLLPESKIKKEILSVVKKLKKKRLMKKNGKKYDIMLIEYFNDMFLILREIYKKMNYGSKNIWVVGDSGLYDEHIKTDVWIGNVSELVGFKFSKCDVLRERKASRHKIKLRESVIYMEK
ncbi:MAG: DNA methyltransferase [Candidatus Woesearchaeota archaeon]